MTVVTPETITATAVAIHDADCPDTHCSGAALGGAYRLAKIALEAAEPLILAPVYAWLVEELGFPFDLATHSRPPWLDVTRLAEAWSKHETDTVENYRLTILEETGWPDETGDPQ